MARCGSDWVIFKNTCYRSFDERRYFDVAKQRCDALNADVLVIESQDEATFYTTWMRYHTYLYSSLRKAWQDCHRYNATHWTCGSGEKERPLVFDNWKRGEPNNAGGRENCMDIDYDGESNDIRCTDSKIPICTTPAIAVQQVSKASKDTETPGYCMRNHVVAHIQPSTLMKCLSACSSNNNCRSLNHYRATQKCEIISMTRIQDSAAYQPTAGCDHYDI
ncbi:ladderlectin-like [Diadema antillarum]|uniref:ladderlectin-like n=1 Tax=Diadema antillarum TaxID=105358 RepID=UPI003A88C5CC